MPQIISPQHDRRPSGRRAGLGRSLATQRLHVAAGPGRADRRLAHALCPRQPFPGIGRGRRRPLAGRPAVDRAAAWPGCFAPACCLATPGPPAQRCFGMPRQPMTRRWRGGFRRRGTIAMAAGVPGSGHARPGVVAGLASRADRGRHALRPADPLARRPPGDRARLAGRLRPPLAASIASAYRLPCGSWRIEGEVRFQLHADLSPHEVEPLFAGLGRRKTADGRARPERRCCERPARRSSCSPRPAGWPRKAGCGWPFSIAAGGTWLSATACLARECSIRSRSATTRLSRRSRPAICCNITLLQALHADPQVTAVDYIGEMTEYHASWRPEVYPFARLAFARRGSVLGRRPCGDFSG